ncbi:hypothetical protein C1H57_09050 [Clostridium sp. 2-1]|uniref:dynamin family protein n=1 Tax=Clostridium TaxID=1485 RepID=UPI000CDA8784|nr:MULTISPECIES: dynamin family protein [Clostridium]MBN7575318.1 dynamin family protein [Clostridium beijerinckii]MBN7580646.1 dynamin family protein [Clostridium beijerinckii]MBN7585082.1 dynamin family protein [Clostridium beijerinckii]MBO0520990.1 dynamin family protein [Clostridium beijerinckii]POO91651.1 hypothetical protein C1H57_09050 [Clostridium sp. 2-1]
MMIEKTFDDFYKSIHKANKCLLNSKILIEEKQEAIQSAVDILKGQAVIEKIDKEEHLSIIKQMCHKQINEYKKTIEQWIKEVNRYVQGKKFVNQFEKSVLLIVFGDVKAGKSALGNFVSGYYLEETEFEKLNSKPQFYVYDHSKKYNNSIGEKILGSDHFEEDEIEATSSIQYFTLLNGLTWVDTPGIHSLTTENQELANEYIKYADLILFVTPSNNPCKQDENQEIDKLIKLDKPLLVTITKSDDQVLGVVNGKMAKILKAKSMQNRKQQEDFVAKTISEMGNGSILSKNKYVSISTKLAKQALEIKDEEMFKESNFPSFYEQISDVISERALELKMKRPKDELNFVIHELINGVEDRKICGIIQMEQNIRLILNEIEKQKYTLDKIKIEIINEVKAQLITDIHEIMYKAKIDGRITDNIYIMNIISEKIHECIGKLVAQKISDILTDFRNYAVQSHKIYTNIGYEKKYETFEYPIYDTKTVRRDPKGIIEHFESWIFDKEFTQTKVINRIASKQIAMGDNYNEVVQKTWSELEGQVCEIIDLEVNRVKNEYFKEIQDTFENMLSTLTQLNNKLTKLKF